MVKKVLLISFLVLVFFSLIPDLTWAKNDILPANKYIPIIRPCTGKILDKKSGEKKCTWNDLEDVINRIIGFILFMIVPPIAVLMLVIGGIIILVSAGDPNLKGLGKQIIKVTIIGLFIAYGSWVIIRFILMAIGTKSQYIPQESSFIPFYKQLTQFKLGSASITQLVE